MSKSSVNNGVAVAAITQPAVPVAVPSTRPSSTSAAALRYAAAVAAGRGDKQGAAQLRAAAAVMSAAVKAWRSLEEVAAQATSDEAALKAAFAPAK